MKHQWRKLTDETHAHDFEWVRRLIGSENVKGIAFDPDEEVFECVGEDEFEGTILSPYSKCLHCGAYIVSDHCGDIVVLLGANSKYECAG